MSVFRRGKVYWIDYYYNGKRMREPVGSRAEARIVHAERIKDIRQGRNPELRRIRPTPFAEMVAEFLEKHVPRVRNPRSYRSKVNVVARHFRGRMLQEIGPKQIDDFIAERLASGVSHATANRMRAVLSKIFSCAIAWGYYGGENPVKKVKRFPEPAGKARFLSPDEAHKLIENSPRHLSPIVLCALHSGGRCSEILKLPWEDVGLKRRVLLFAQENTKSGKQREVPIDDELAAVLENLGKVRLIKGRDQGRVFTWRRRPLKSVRTAFERARKRAGLGADVTFHTLRHTFASWYMINGGDLYRLQKLLGHSTIVLTQRYAHLSKDYLRDSVRFFGPPAAQGGHKSVTNAG